MASLIEAINIKRKMFFEHEGAPYHCIDVEGLAARRRGADRRLVRLKMRNLLTRAVFDRTFKAGETAFSVNGSGPDQGGLLSPMLTNDGYCTSWTRTASRR